MLKPWWEQWPDRLEYELEELRRAGIQVLSQETAGTRITLSLKHRLAGQDVALEARFPDLYPYTRFELYAPGLDLPRHQNPFQKNLCLVPQETEHWRTTDTLADFIVRQLPRVVEAATATDPDAIAALEARQAEPFSHYYDYQDGSMLMIDGSWQLSAAASRGELQIEMIRRGPALHGVVLAVRDNAGSSLFECDPALRGFSDSIEGRWVRLEEPIRRGSADAFARALVDRRPELRNPRWKTFGNLRVDIVGVIFPEEVAWRRIRDGWVFLVRVEVQRKGFRTFAENRLVRAGRAGRADLAVRVPELSPVRNKAIALFGLGCVGAPSCLEFARAGVGTLRILDHDLVEPGITVRWPLGVRQAGLSKVEAMRRFIASEFPYTQIQSYGYRIGSVSDGPGDIEALKQMTEGCDLIYDATAELGLQHLLADLARSLGLPYIAVSTTAGAWGGRVLRIRPSNTGGCWSCLQHYMDDSTIPMPPASDTGWVEPEGCNSPTFTGTSFDIGNVSLMGVRLAVGTLCEGKNGGYPDFDWDVGVLSLRDVEGKPVPPSWVVFRLERHPSCENH